MEKIRSETEKIGAEMAKRQKEIPPKRRDKTHSHRKNNHYATSPEPR